MLVIGYPIPSTELQVDQIIVLTPDQLTEIVSDAVEVGVSRTHKPPPLVMSKQQLADHLDKPISTINRWMTQGLPYRKEGNEYPEFYRPQVERWLEERFSDAPIELRRVA